MDEILHSGKTWRSVMVGAFALLGLINSTACAASHPSSATQEISTPEASAATRPVAPLPVFDPEKYMRVSEVRPGMTGYGLSVFHGSAIERFDVTVVSILHNFNPKFDVVLISCAGANLEHTGSIAGMSGSPIFLRDDKGRDRMLGAFAYGWPMAKDPLAGVQPIEYMLGINDNPAAASNAGADSRKALGTGAKTWSLLETKLSSILAASHANQSGSSVTHLTGNAQMPNLQPLATPLMTSGLSARVLDQIGPQFREYGLIPMEAGASSSPESGNKPIEFERGSVLAVPLVWGDADITAIGTCTEVIDDRVYGFGHAFNNEGPIALPMATGTINGIVANLTTSFKIGAADQVRGTLLADQTVGVAGIIGSKPVTIPVNLKLHYAHPAHDQAFHFQIVQHHMFTPLAAMATISIALNGAGELPQFHTVNYDLDLTFANNRVVRVHNTDVNDGLAKIAAQLGVPIEAANDNPFERVPLTSISGSIQVVSEAQEAKVLSVTLPRLKYRPGETVKLYANYRPFRGNEATLPIEFELPRDLPEGTYPLLVTDFATYIEAEKTARPFRFTAETASEMFAVLDDILPLPHNALYVQLMRQQDGVAIGHTAMPHLPSSRRQVLMQEGISDTTPFISSNLKIVPTPFLMTGSADFQITIDRQAKVETGSTPNQPLPRSAAPPGPAPAASQPGH